MRRLLERPLLVFYLRTRAKVNVSEHQENDARNGFCGCVEMCFGYRASMRKPIESRAGRKNGRAPIVEKACSFVELVSLR